MLHAPPKVFTTRLLIGLFVLLAATRVLGQVSDLPVVPPWIARGDTLPSPAMVYAAEGESESTCAQILDFAGTQDGFAVWFDPYTGKTQIFMGDYHNNRIVMHVINAALERTVVPLSIPYGHVWLAADLDLDGDMELVVQRGDPGFGGNGYLDILSAPLWTPRARFVLPGMKTYSYPSLVNIDDDPYPEIHLAPNGFGTPNRIQLIKFDPETVTFTRIADIPAPPGTQGPSAIGDFDNDGKIEFITGNWCGYDLFEFDNGILRHVGRIVDDPDCDNNFRAVSTRPYPGGELHALVGRSATTVGFQYQLLRATGDNTFEVVRTFQEKTGFGGASPCFTADVDCDGLDELMMSFHPLTKVWEWDVYVDSFVLGCVWDANQYAVFSEVTPIDLNQDGVNEWGTVTYFNAFKSFRDTRCRSCTTPPQGLVAWWPLDESELAIAKDVWGHADGMLVGDFAPLSGKVAGALGFGGSEDYVRVPSGVCPEIGTGDFSCAFWFRAGNVAPLSPILSKLDTLGQMGWALWIEDGNVIALRIGDGTFDNYLAPIPGNLANGTWRHVAVSVERGSSVGISFFLDGAIVGVADPTGHPGSLSNGADLVLGAASVLADQTSYLFAVLDEVQIFDRVLTPHEILEMFESDSLGQCKPRRTCDCRDHGDLNDDGVLDVADVQSLIQHVFFGSPSPPGDPSCPLRDRGDLNCDLVDNAVDLAHIIDVVYFGGALPCEPCR